MPAGFQTPIPVEPAAPPEPEETIAPTQPKEPIAEPEEPAPQPTREEPKVKIEPKKVAKEETQKEVPKKVSSAAKVVAKAPVVDMFADEVDKKEDVKKGASKTMPVYGTLKVEYEIDEEEEEEEEEEAQEEVEQSKEVELQQPSTKKLGAYSMFVKGDVLPGSKDEDKPSKKSTNPLSHYDVSLDEDSQDSRTNGDAGTDEEEEEDVVEMDVGDDLDIDQQLELALERKKVRFTAISKFPATRCNQRISRSCMV